MVPDIRTVPRERLVAAFGELVDRIAGGAGSGRAGDR